MRRLARLVTAMSALLLALALVPAQAFAEEWTPAPLENDPYAELWGAEEGEAPLGTSAEEAPEDAAAIKSITITNVNTAFVPGQHVWFGAKVDPSDPNKDYLSIEFEYWLISIPNPPTSSPIPYGPMFGSKPGTAYSSPMPSYEQLQDAGFPYANEFNYGFVVVASGGRELASSVTVSYLGKSYKCITDSISSGDGNTSYMVVPVGLTAKIAYPVPLYRMYNTKTSEHLWTRNKKEYDSAGSGSYADWKAEGVAWYAPVSSAKPVWRLYNTKSGDHHYTTSAAEKASLLASGQWRDEGIAFYSATAKDTNTIKVYRVYNGRLKRGQHHYTKSAAERDSLVKNNGWKDEGVGFYGYSSAKPKTAPAL